MIRHTTGAVLWLIVALVPGTATPCEYDDCHSTGAVSKPGGCRIDGRPRAWWAPLVLGLALVLRRR
ncbi:MAG: hypothetical protein QGH45_02320 [Myxococcota bacterium]|nr:hypothetical protein [Myxococcota bacterium]